MSTSKHTPGPWAAGQVGSGQCFDIIGPDVTGLGREIVGTLRASQGKDANSANARLIAAAPELMAALIATDAAMREHPCGDCRSDEDIALARAAIAKAEGRAA